jgi:hypothetical protein
MQMGACGQKLMQHRHSQAVCNDVHSPCGLLQYTNVRAGACCDTECKGRAKLCKICDHQMCGGRGMLFGILQQDM